MMQIKSHFTFTTKQRNGIFLLLTIVIALQCVYFFIDFSSDEIIVNQMELAAFHKEMDSLRQVEIQNRKPKIYPFNPNFITDYKGYTLGMTNEEIDRLLNFRKQDKWVNSVKQFQLVTQVSDSLLNKISPHFKFPEWVTNPKSKTNSVSKTNAYSNTPIPKTFEQKTDLNKATALQLQKVYGIGKAYSERIIKYREKHHGFISDIELEEIYGLSSEVINRITQDFTVKTPKPVNTISLNDASRDEMVKIVYIDYEIAYQIIEQRTLKQGFKSFEELRKVKDFPIHKIEIIKLYLTLD